MAADDWKPPKFMKKALNHDGGSFLLEKKRNTDRDLLKLKKTNKASTPRKIVKPPNTKKKNRIKPQTPKANGYERNRVQSNKPQKKKLKTKVVTNGKKYKSKKKKSKSKPNEISIQIESKRDNMIMKKTKSMNEHDTFLNEVVNQMTPKEQKQMKSILSANKYDDTQKLKEAKQEITINNENENEIKQQLIDVDVDVDVELIENKQEIIQISDTLHTHNNIDDQYNEFDSEQKQEVIDDQTKNNDNNDTIEIINSNNVINEAFILPQNTENEKEAKHEVIDDEIFNDTPNTDATYKETQQLIEIKKNDAIHQISDKIINDAAIHTQSQNNENKKDSDVESVETDNKPKPEVLDIQSIAEILIDSNNTDHEYTETQQNGIQVDSQINNNDNENIDEMSSDINNNKVYDNEMINEKINEKETKQDSIEADNKTSEWNHDQQTASPRVLKIISTEERKGSFKKKIQKHTVYIIEYDSSPTDISTVCRRYNDFKWLRHILCVQFPGLFVPPLPPPKVIGRFHDSFVEERRQDLQRFLNRVEQIKPFSECTAFALFLSHVIETAFVEQRKQIEDELKNRTKEDIALLLNALFPYLSEQDLKDQMYDNISNLKGFLIKIENQMTELNKTAVRLLKHFNCVPKQILLLKESLDALHATEIDYAYKTKHKRFDVREAIQFWCLNETKQTDTYYDNFVRLLRYEHEDIKSFLELFKYHQDLVKKYRKVCKSIDKWNQMETNGVQLKVTQNRQKSIDSVERKQLLLVLNVLTQIILKHEIIVIWNYKMKVWSDRMQHFGKIHAQIRHNMLNSWEKAAILWNIDK